MGICFLFLGARLLAASAAFEARSAVAAELLRGLSQTELREGVAACIEARSAEIAGG